jgi:hypothetical protein
MEINSTALIVMKGDVKIKTHVLFKKKRYMQLQTNGMLSILRKKDGKVEE